MRPYTPTVHFPGIGAVTTSARWLKAPMSSSAADSAATWQFGSYSRR